MTYCIVTPAKNEEDMLPKTIESVVNQTLKPSLWVIVDDGSTDSTPEIIKSACDRHSYIKSLRLTEGKREPGIHIAEVCRSGFQYINTLTGNYSFIGVLDADVILEGNYFEILIGKFTENNKLGIASGGLYTLDRHGTPKTQALSIHHPINSARLFRKECFDEVGGFLPVNAFDTVEIIKAELRGWETRQYPGMKAIQLRAPASYGGIWRGHKRLGYQAYYLNQHPFSLSARIVKKAFVDKQPIGALAITYGYAKSWIRKAEKIPDDEVRQYFWNFNRKRLMQDAKRMLFHKKGGHT